MLRGATRGTDDRTEFDGFVVDHAAHRVSFHDHPIVLGPMEYRLLEFLMTHPDRAYT